MDATDSVAGMEDGSTAGNGTVQAPAPSDLQQAVTWLWELCLPVIIVLGTVGNVATIIVMRRLKDDNSSYHAVLTALAVSDLGLLYSTVFSKWLRTSFNFNLQVLHPLTCKLLTWMVYAFNTMSVWLVTGVTVQRTLAVKWPHKIRMMCTARRTRGVIAAIAFAACVVNVHFLFGVDLVEEGCSIEQWPEYFEFYVNVWLSVDMMISTIIPSVCLIVCDVILSLAMYRASSISSGAAPVVPNTDTAASGNSRRKAASKTTVMILAVSSAFLVLNLPLCIIFLVQQFRYDLLAPAVWSVVTVAGFILWYTNSAVNFFLYCLTGTKFRREVLSLLLCETLRRTSTSGNK